jgi:hypothetical protein
MREKDIENLVFMIIVLGVTLMCLLVGFRRGVYSTESRFQKEAVERGFAYHNPTNGNWQWKE